MTILRDHISYHNWIESIFLNILKLIPEHSLTRWFVAFSAVHKSLRWIASLLNMHLSLNPLMRWQMFPLSAGNWESSSLPMPHTNRFNMSCRFRKPLRLSPGKRFSLKGPWSPKYRIYIYPTVIIKCVELCKGADKLRVPLQEITKEIAPLRRTLGIHRRLPGHFEEKRYHFGSKSVSDFVFTGIHVKQFWDGSITLKTRPNM